MSQILARANALEWERVREQGHDSEGRQPRRVWCVEALKPVLTEQEYAAGARAVRECILFFPGAKEQLDRVDCAWSDASMAAIVDAGHNLFGLRQAVSSRCGGIRARHAANCVEWIVQLWTLQDIACTLGHYRKRGLHRPKEPDLRTTKPFVRLVLLTMAGYYEDCDAGRNWRPKNTLDGWTEHQQESASCYSRAQGETP